MSRGELQSSNIFEEQPDSPGHVQFTLGSQITHSNYIQCHADEKHGQSPVPSPHLPQLPRSWPTSTADCFLLFIVCVLLVFLCSSAYTRFTQSQPDLEAVVETSSSTTAAPIITNSVITNSVITNTVINNGVVNNGVVNNGIGKLEKAEERTSAAKIATINQLGDTNNSLSMEGSKKTLDMEIEQDTKFEQVRFSRDSKQFQANRDSLTSYFKQLKNAGEYTSMWKIRQVRQLPFCIFLDPSSATYLQTMQSVLDQNYQNYLISEETTETGQYLFYKEIIHRQCEENALVLFLRNPVAKDTLANLNTYHQRFYAWATYTEVREVGVSRIEVYSFYSRIYDLLQNNDFHHRNLMFMSGKGWESSVALGIIELCEYHVKHIGGTVKQGTTALYIDIEQEASTNRMNGRVAYTRLYKLSQDYAVEVAREQARYEDVKNRKNQRFNQMTVEKMHKAIQREQIPYIPGAHDLNSLEYLELDSLYNISKYESAEEQLPLCICVMSYNNDQNGRNIKALQSILLQEYSNYHIVFIDDFSSDSNMETSIQYLKGQNFDMRRVKFIQNKRRNFVTYNIVNAAFNFCQSGDIQVLMDGDDEFIGRNLFLLLNAIYQQHQDKWVVYTNSKSNLYTYGTSQFIKSRNWLVRNGKRRSNHLIGPVRSWRVELMYSIPLPYHKNRDGKWLDTVSDDALQHSIYELAGINRIEYIPEIMYEYNKQYGNNDDSSWEKLNHRKQTYDWVLQMTPLSKMQSLATAHKNPAVDSELNQDFGVSFAPRQP